MARLTLYRGDKCSRGILRATSGSIGNVDAVAGASRAVIFQLALWPPHREVVLGPRRPFASRLSARIAILELAVISFDRTTAADDTYPCTYPGCARGPDHPFETSGQLGNHRLAAHGIRSTNEESIRRQERRDRRRAQKLGEAPEYIDPIRIRASVGAALRAPAGVALIDGPLDLGEREHVRRRLTHFVGHALPREIGRAPAEICLAVAEIAASALAPAYPKISESVRADIQTERLTQLFTKTTAVAQAV